jgi:hypothetical protein
MAAATWALLGWSAGIVTYRAIVHWSVWRGYATCDRCGWLYGREYAEHVSGLRVCGAYCAWAVNKEASK